MKNITDLYNEVCESITLLVRENESLRNEVKHLKDMTETNNRGEIESLKAEIESLHDTIQTLENEKITHQEKFQTILKILGNSAKTTPSSAPVASNPVPSEPANPDEAKEEITPRRGPDPVKKSVTPEKTPAEVSKPAVVTAAVDHTYKEDDPFTEEGEFQDDDDFFKSLTSKSSE